MRHHQVTMATLIAATTLLTTSEARSTCIDYADFMQATGYASTAGVVNDLATSGNYAYIAVASAGLQVADLSNPDAPAIVALAATGDSRGVACSGSYAYVACGNAGLRVVNISNPLSPTVVATLDTPGAANGVAIQGNYAYVGDGTQGLQVISIANPLAPSIVGHATLPGSSSDVAVLGSLAFVVGGTSGWSVVRVVTPSAPVVLSTIVSGTTRSVEPFSHYVAVAEAAGTVRVYDVANASSPAVISSIATQAEMYKTALRGSVLFVPAAYDNTAFTASVVSVDLSNPANPVEIGRTGLLADGRAIAFAGDRGFVGTNYPTQGLISVAAANPATVAMLGHAAVGNPDEFTLSDGIAYLPESSLGVRAIDVTNPAAPVQVGTLTTPGSVYAVAAQGDYLYVSDSASGLLVVDKTNPAAMSIVATYAMTTGGSLQIGGSVLYSLTGSNLCAVDIGNPLSPSLLSCTPISGGLNITISGSLVFITTISGLSIVDGSNPAAPQVVGSLALDHTPYYCAVFGDHLYLAETGARLQIVDASALNAPVVVETMQFTGHTFHVKVVDQLLYLANGGGGFVILDLADPVHPREISGHVKTASQRASFVVPSGDAIFSLSGEGQFNAFPGQCSLAAEVPAGIAPSSAIRSIAPNPSTGVVSVSFTREAAAWGAIRIVDAAGRQVVTMSDPTASRWDWDGKDELGRTVPAGVYYLMAPLPGGSWDSRPIVRLNP